MYALCIPFDYLCSFIKVSLNLTGRVGVNAPCPVIFSF